MVEAMAGHVMMESGDLDGAIARFKAALVRYPNKMQLVYDYPEALLKAKRPKEAADFLEQQLQRFPDNGNLHRIAAQAYADMGKRMQQHYHQAEYYAWQGNLRGAVFQLEQAAKAGDGDFYQASVIEARLRTMRRDLADLFCTTAEGVRAERAKAWNLVDGSAPPQRFIENVAARARRRPGP